MNKYLIDKRDLKNVKNFKAFKKELCWVLKGDDLPQNINHPFWDDHVVFRTLNDAKAWWLNYKKENY